jgi:excisionase family DNA binding protein
MKTPAMTIENAFGPLVRAIVQEVLGELGHGQTDAAQRRLYSPEEAAAYLALSKREIYNMIAGGRLPAVQHGRRKMVDIRDLEEWVDEKKR